MEPEPHNSIHPVQRLHSAHVEVTTAQHRMLEAVVACDRDHLWERDGAHDFAQWLSAELGISNWESRRFITAAHALSELPRISAAFKAGELSLVKVLDLCRFASADDEARLIRWAQKVTPSAVRRKADVEVSRPRSEAEEQDRQCYLSYWFTDDNSVLFIQGAVPGDHGAVVAKALDRQAGRVPDIVDDEDIDASDDDTTFSESLERRRAHALVAMCSAAIADDQDADAATLVVHCDFDALIGDGKGAVVENGPVLSAQALARLRCDARLQVVIHNEDGKINRIGTTSYKVPRHLKRQLRYRHGGCTFPGCEARWFLHAHHIVPWPEGPTELDNLVLVCMFHHKLVHEYGWGVRLESDDSVTWFRPEGRVFEPGRAPPQLVA